MRSKKKVLWLVGAMTLVAVAAFAPVSSAESRLAIRAGRLIDGLGGPPLSPAVILIDGDEIVAVGRDLAIPSDREVIDLSSATVLPGLIDCHTHLTSAPGRARDPRSKSSRGAPGHEGHEDDNRDPHAAADDELRPRASS